METYPILGVAYFTLKVVALLYLFMWIRATMPRLRYDQLMRFAWKFLLPVALANVFVTALWVALRS